VTFPISLVLPELPPLKIVDVGAMNTGDEPYAQLLESCDCALVGFEPLEAECRKLNAAARAGALFLPHVIGDGAQHTFHECAAGYNSSLLEPDMALLEHFTDFAPLFRVVASRPVRTTRLDDIPEAAGADFLKIDTQGAELMVLDGARELLRAVLVVHIEAQFVPLYKGAPSFGDIERRLRAAGFLLHRIAYHGLRPFAPFPAQEDRLSVVSQMVWCDAVYARDFTALERLAPGQLLKLAAILHENFGSCDLAGVVLGAHDRRAGSRLRAEYLDCFAT
jgi:FkbM family methyltransferase